ncbi:MAG: glycosyltransferase [Candidatus Methylomirabilales bacterium]
MRIALITPAYYPSVRGNAITVQRIASGLREHGHQLEIYSLEAYQDRREIPAAIRAFGPDLLHGFHAFVTGDLVVSEGRQAGVPALVTITGTDVNIDLFHPKRRGSVVEILKRMQGVVAFHQSIRDKLVAEVPELDGKIRVIRQTVTCEERSGDYRAQWGFGPRHILFFFAAGIRKVKNLPFSFPALVRLHARHPELRVLYAGPILEEEEGRHFLSLLAGNAWARYLGEVPHEEICGMLQEVDVVVNSSLSEGGMSNALLEAMSRGVVVLASDIEGNRSIIVNEVDGLLFTAEEDFERKAERLILDSDLRHRLGGKAKAKIEKEYSGVQEIEAYEGFYRDLLGAGMTGDR